MATNKKWLMFVLIVTVLVFGARISSIIRLSNIKGVSAQQVNASEGQERISANLTKDKKRVELRDLKGDLTVSFPVEKLNLDKHFPIKEEFKKEDSAHSDFLMRDGNSLFFSISRGFYCGANNCTWGIYTNESGQVDILAKKVVGNIIQMVASPDKSKIAILNYFHGGYCNNGNYLYVIDKESKKTIKIDSLNLDKYYDSEVKQLSWDNNQEIKAKVLNFCSPTGEQSIIRQVKCSISYDSNQVDCNEI